MSRALGVLDADARGLAPLVRRAVARALGYARACSPGVEFPVRRIAGWNPGEHLVIDAVAARHLELVTSSLGAKSETLLSVIDQTSTPPGARLLRRRLLAPLMDVARIRRRLDTRSSCSWRTRALRADLIFALYRASATWNASRSGATLGEATPRDLGRLRDGLRAARLRGRCARRAGSHGSHRTRGAGTIPRFRSTPWTTSARRLDRAPVDAPPVDAKEGATFRDAFEHTELFAGSGCVAASSGRSSWWRSRHASKTQTGIPTLKGLQVFTRVFGWYIEVTRSHAGRVPATFRRKQTVAGGERFSLPWRSTTWRIGSSTPRNAIARA